MDTLLEIIIDYSASMGPLVQDGKDYKLPDGSTRMELAKNALVDVIIPSLEYSGSIRVRTFYASSNVLKIEELYKGVFIKDEVLRKIKLLPDPVNTGGTPIAAALQQSIDYLKGFPSTDRKIVLVTDGEENGGGNFRKTAENGLKDHGVNYNFFIIGIGQDAVTVENCKQLAEGTKGGYINLQTKNYNKKELSDALRNLTFKAVSSTVNTIQLNNQKAITAIQDNSSKSLSEPLQKVNDLVKVVSEQSRSIDLLSKQLTNLNEGLQSVSINSETCLKKIDSINLLEYFTKAQTSYKGDLNQVSQSQQVAIFELKQSLEELKRQFSQLAIALTQQKNNKNEGILLNAINKLSNEVAQSKAAINSHTKTVIDGLYFESRYRKLDENVCTVHSELLKNRRLLEALDTRISKGLLNNARERWFWRLIIIVGITIALVIAVFMFSKYGQNFF